MPTGKVAVQTDPPDVDPGPQCNTLAVPVAEGAVTSQVVVFRPSLYTVSVESSADACDPGKQEPGVGGLPLGLGSTSGQLNVAVAVWIDPSTAVASAMIVALPLPNALATPAFSCPWLEPLFVLTGKTFGADVSHLTVLVRSLT